MKEIVVVWFDPGILSAEQLEMVRQQLDGFFGEGEFLLLPIGITRVEVLK